MRMMLVSILVLVTLTRECSGVADLLRYKGVATDLTFEYLTQSAGGPTRTVDRTISTPIRFFGETFSSIRIFESGVVILRTAAPMAACPSSLTSAAELNDHYIAAYHRRGIANFLGKGRIFFQDKVYNPQSDSRIVNDIRIAFASDVINENNFTPTRLVVVTWDNIGSFDEGSRTLRNTFQLVIAIGGDKSFGVFLFNDIQYYAEQDQFNNFCTRPAKVGIRSGPLTYWISNEVTRLEQAKRINVYTNIKLYDKNYLGRYCLRFFGVRTTNDPNLPILFPRPAPALQQNCAGPDPHPVCQANVPDDFCVGKTGEQRHPNLCSMFVYCDWDQVRDIKSCPGPGSNTQCPEGMTWNSHLRFCSCDNAQNCQTGDFSDFDLAYGVNTTAGTEYKTPNLFVDLDCEYYPNGNYIDFNECGTYYSCSNTRNIKMGCPAGLVWNPVHVNGGYGGYCDYVYNVDCTRAEFRNPTSTASSTTRTTPASTTTQTTTTQTTPSTTTASTTTPTRTVPTTPLTWSEWSQWGECQGSATAQLCFRRRQRFCLSNSGCAGSNLEIGFCECPIPTTRTPRIP